ncbi:MAG: chromosomal replication initiator protein DnaA [bacterium]
MDTKELWNGIKADLQLGISGAHFSTWIEPLSIEGYAETEGGEAKLGLKCPSTYVRAMVTDKYVDQIVAAAERITGRRVALDIAIGKTTKQATITQDKEVDGSLFEQQTQTPRQEPQHNLNPRLTLDTYVVGSSNNFAHAAALGVIKNPGRKYNPLFIYGGVGLGKTHLMHAIGHAILENNPRAKILYISAETFGNDLIASLQSKKTANFKKRYRSCDVLMVDDIQFISGKEYTQEEFFHTFNELYMSERQIILTSDRPPQEIPKIEERLSSRFLGGLTVDIQPPDYEMRAAILTQKAKEMEIDVSAQSLSLIAEHSATNARELEGIFRRIVALADSKNSPITPELVSTFYGVVQEGRRSRLRPNIIISRTAKYFGYKAQDLISNSRKAPLVAARHVAMFLIKTELDVPHEQIGELFGGRDHTTIMHAVDKITAEISVNQQVGRAISDIKHELSTSGNQES